MSILELTDNKKNEWNDFVQNHEESHFFHLAEWKNILESVFKAQCFYLYEESAGAITSILPLAYIKRPIFGPALISLPIAVYGGALGDTQELEQAALKKAKQLGVEYLEIRSKERSDQTNWIYTDQFSTFIKALDGDNDVNFQNIKRKQRAEVRKAIDFNLQTKRDDNIDLFYKLYSLSVRNLGTPVFAKKFVSQIFEHFPQQCEITTIFDQSEALSSVLSFKFKDTIMPYYGGGTPKCRDKHAYPFMYWKVMENSVNEGLSVFDFGRSINKSGAYNFKKYFGFEPTPLHYKYALIKATEKPNMNPNSTRNKAVMNIWKKMPVSLANQIGPILYPAIM